MSNAVWAKHRALHLPDDAEQMRYMLCHGRWLSLCVCLACMLKSRGPIKRIRSLLRKVHIAPGQLLMV